MALTEQKILKSVEVLSSINSIQVEWANQVLKDGEVISSIPHRSSYMAGEQERFLAEVEGADKYVGLIDWTVKEEAPVDAQA